MRRRTLSSTLTDGNILAATVRPPVSHLPKPFTKLVEENASIGARLATARSALVELTDDPYIGRLPSETARRADADAAALAARRGDTIESPTEHLDALNRQRDEHAAQVKALEAALHLVKNDSWDLRHREAANPAHRKALNLANDRLAKAGAEFAAAIDAAVTALALVEWLEDGLPWDASARVLPTDALPGLENQVGPALAHVPDQPATDVISALVRIADLPTRKD